MSYLILTRAGFESLLAGTAGLPTGTALFINPGIAAPEELARLHTAGIQADVLDAVVAPADAASFVASGAIARAGTPVWIEATQPAPQQALPVTATATPTPSPRRRRLAATVGMLAGAARNAALYGMARRQLMLLPYLGYGGAGGIWLKGRVLQERAFASQGAQDSGWRNLAALYRRLESDEVAGEAVAARFGGQTYLTRTDSGGYFAFEIKPPASWQPGWLTVELELPDASESGNGATTRVHANGRVLMPAMDASFGVISDIDDTVLWTNVTNKLNMALMLARSNPHTRQPFKGVAAFYRALRDGVQASVQAGMQANAAAANPLFYVSSSPWHLFGHLLEFMRLQGMPVGPLLLRELSLRQLFHMHQHGNHKLGKIEHILATYPHLQFVLIGDSGEQDPEIYAEVVRRHPRRIRVIYIRNVNPDPVRVAALDRLVAEVAATGTQLIVAADSEAAATHAAAEGLIDVARLAEVRADLREDARAGSDPQPAPPA